MIRKSLSFGTVDSDGSRSFFMKTDFDDGNLFELAIEWISDLLNIYMVDFDKVEWHGYHTVQKPFVNTVLVKFTVSKGGYNMMSRSSVDEQVDELDEVVYEKARLIKTGKVATPEPDGGGVWVVYKLVIETAFDNHFSIRPLFVSDEEIKALRWAVEHENCSVKFWNFNTTWGD